MGRAGGGLDGGGLGTGGLKGCCCLVVCSFTVRLPGGGNSEAGLVIIVIVGVGTVVCLLD